MTPQQLLAILRARRAGIGIALALAAAVAVAASLLLPERYTATARVLVQVGGPDAVLGVGASSAPTPAVLATQVDIATSQRVALQVVDALKLADSPQAIAERRASGGAGSIRHQWSDRLLQDLDVAPSGESSVLSISYTASDPAFAATVANAFADAYVSLVLELRTDAARQAGAVVESRLRSLREETGIAYEGRQRGTLQLLRTRAQFEAARRDIAVLEAAGIEWRLLQAEALGTVEPALGGRAAAFAGGLHLPGDETGDCHRFTQALAARAAALGVRFEHGAQVEGLVVEPARGARRLRGVRVDGVVREAEATVVALGVWSRELVRDAGLALPLYPMKGYSLTLPLADAQRAPVSTVLDETWKVAVTRFDARIRVGGMAEVAGHDLRLEPARRATLERVLGELFPGAAAREGGTFWSGLRPKTPDSTPIVGATPVEGLWLNTGHGTLGWTLACGSAALLADLVLQRHPAISPDGLDIARYAGGSSRRPRLAPSAAPGTAASVTRHAAS